MKKKVLIICLIVVMGGIASLLTINQVKESKKVSEVQSVPVLKEQEVVKPTIELITPSQEVESVYMAPDGTVKTEKKVFKGDNIQKVVILDTFGRYNTDEYKKEITLPKDLMINSIKVENETLKVDFSKDIKNMKFKDILSEQTFVRSLVNTIQNTSTKDIKFNDVLFMVDGERDEHVFGMINTKYPLRFLQGS